ncbi:archaea-specific SMC-related protein [Natrinema versiforme]|uniref:Chromosome segregation protein SMC n=1 Tax=Natrinema versiforme TaxID=88724 RepID=A0A4P8WMF7_9EURY|nr:archaea-specific SMC-related protein [Natrinema versiforme]QCS44777.1 chromosome segregation protein SMC [Natrinema versiforme]
MKPKTSADARAALSVERIGGIEETSVEFVPSVNVLQGRNATNRTSLLRAIMAALGSNDVALKGDADQGSVELTIQGVTYTRTLERSGNTTTMSDDPYLEDSTLADLFAFLLESNEARRTVTRGDDLHDVIMRPVDTDEIEREISEAERRKDELDNQLAELRTSKERLPELQSERVSIADELTDKRADLENLREELEAAESGVDEMQAQREAYQETLTELNDTQAELDEIDRKLDNKKTQREALQNERSDLREERSELPTSVEEINELGQRIGELQERRRALGSLLDRLQNIIQFNEEIIDNADSELREVVVPSDEDTDLTDRLMTEQDLVCWTCGSTVDRSEIEDTLEDLQEFRQEKMSERKDISDELNDLRERKRETEKKQQRREQIDQQLQQIDDRIEQQTQRIEELRDRRETLRERVGELERELEEAKPERDDDRVLELNKRENELALTIEELESDLETIGAKIDDIEADVTEIPEIEEERKSVADRLTDLRNRINDIEADAVEAFNDHMENLIQRLDYDNLERIWIERQETTVRDGRRSIPKTEFDLHVVRTTADGTAYEDTVDHLSESEREVTGLVFALAGYLVHEVYDEVPFMLLDSLEAIDSNRIAALVDYFEEYAEFLVVALLPEDAQAVDEQYHRVTEI